MGDVTTVGTRIEVRAKSREASAPHYVVSGQQADDFDVLPPLESAEVTCTLNSAADAHTLMTVAARLRAKLETK